MTFSSIVRKNFIYNARKYMSLYFVNTLIVAILFMFGSLLFNSDVYRQVGTTTLYEVIKSALMGVVLFSIVFITYSNISFMKYRGKEFGMYITLGMTTKDLTRLLFLEQAGILIISLVTGLVSGGVFSKLFYMGLNQMLIINPIRFEFSVNSLLLSSGIFLLIFICNFIFNILYVRKTSIIDVLNASSKKGVGKSNLILGMITMFVFVVSAYLLPKVLLKQVFQNQSYMFILFLVLTLICPYIIFGTLIVVIKSVMKLFKKTYNNNLIVLSNLSHRFLAYKSTLYIVSILIAGAIFFIGMFYSMYATSRDNNDMENPFDIMFVETNQLNMMNAGEVEQILKEQGNTIEQNSTLEFIELPQFRDYKGAMVLWDDRTCIISESLFNQHMGTQYELKADQAMESRLRAENMKHEIPTTFISLMNTEQLDTQFQESMSKEGLVQALAQYPYVEYPSQHITSINLPFINFSDLAGGYYGTALVVDDQVYDQWKAEIRQEQIKKFHLIKGDINEQGYQSLVNALRERNGFEMDDLKPIYKEGEFKRKLESNGTIFFIVLFLGALFAIASGVVLFHKVLSDIEDQKESLYSLQRMGVTSKELKNIISKELAITFFFPTLFGLGLGLYYFYVLFSNRPNVLDVVGKASIVALIFLVLQIIFYFVSRRKYFSELAKSL
ncbi:ABC-type antimicrobial peptide transport system permease subunit [Paenibacillus anaericanus]|uniref:ABC transporter permease n=1 Tax=Paenibacillus anaericanus TaxID=170367 RepID=UPI0027807ADE|nr:ABC transporter permease [Paenibacillus anaericanus]MDQ0089928.1 ABC-type antimicrobial peptide transport system permease subunit [Paenibacillus anaericanus]